MTQLHVRPPTGPPPSGSATPPDEKRERRLQRALAPVRGWLQRVPLPRSLTARLVATAVALVAVVCLLIGTVTTVAIHSSLMARLDSDVQDLAASAVHESGPDTHNRGPGTLLFIYGSQAARGGVVGSEISQVDGLSRADATTLQQVPADATPHTVQVPGFGSYRVIAQTVQTPDGALVVVTGLPTHDVDDTVRRLLIWELALTALGILAAAAAGLLLVRRQLRPLREVAATAHTVARQPLASGEVGEISRVPARLTDSNTEVGQVGAALNTLLDHVEVSLEARHQSEQQVRQFVADASHELRTPLTTIRGYTELARRRPEDAETAATALAKVEEESGRMTSLVEDLLLLARLDQGRPLDREPVDLSRLLLEAVSDARVVAPDHHWVLALPEEPVEVAGDEMRLHQVVSNLLANARAYAPPGTTVTVAAHAHGFVVHDDGPGFPPDLVPVAFERFTRGDSGRQREAAAGGAGLGLSLVRAIVASHGGEVSLASAPGDTSITVRLPR